MSMNLESILRITAQVAGEEQVRALSSNIQTLEGNAKSLKSTFSNVISSATFQAAAVAAAALGTGIALATGKAMEFETSLADVRKVVDGLDNAAGMATLKRELFDLSRQIPLTASEFAQLYAAAAQSGVARSELKQFATDVAMLAVSFDMTAKDAGTAMAKLKTSLGLSLPELRLLTDAMNTLSNNMGVAGADIVNFTLRTANTGKAVNMSAQQTAAFGTAMMAAGAEAEVAATSFNNMVKMLGRGDSMTERQIGALVKLGYATKQQAGAEKELREAVERESARRIAAIEQESQRVISDIRRRYRDIRTIMQDGWDDDATAYQDSLDDRYDKQRKAIERERQAEIEASNNRAEATKSDNTRELQAIEDKYDERLKQLSRAQRDEATEYRRNQRDYQQTVLDALEDQEKMEIDAAEAKYKELKRIEELRKKDALEAAKAAADAIVKQLGPEMAKRLNRDAVGTIRDVFDRIRKLPEEMQLEVVSNLFGDEARALLPLIKNTELLDKALALVADKNKYAGSSAREFAQYINTSAAKAALAKAAIDELVITFGENFAPVLVKVLQALTPIADALTWLMTNVPGIGPAIVILSTAFIGLVGVSPFLLSFIQLLGMLKNALGVGTVASTAGSALAKTAPVFRAGIQGILQAFNPLFAATLPQRLAAIWGTVQFALQDFGVWLSTKAGPLLLNGLRTAFQGVMTFFAEGGLMTAVRGLFMNLGRMFASFFGPELLAILGTGIRAIAAFFSGPVGWALLIAGLVVLIYQFRDQIGAFFVWVGEAISGWIQSLWAWSEPVRQWWSGIWEQAQARFGEFVAWFGQGLYNWFVQPWITVGTAILQAAAQLWESVKATVTGFFVWIGETISSWLQSLAQWGTQIVQWWSSVWETAKTAFSNFVTWFGQGLYNWFVKPWVDLGKLLVDASIAVWNAVKTPIAQFFDWWAINLYKLFIEPFVVLVPKLLELIVQVFGAIGRFIAETWQAVSSAFNDYVVKPLQSGLNSLVQMAGDAIRAIGDALRNGWNGVATAFVDNVAKPIGAAWESLTTKLGQLWAAFVQQFGSALQSFGNLFQQAFSSVANAFNSYVVQPISNGWTNLVNLIGEKAAAIGNAIKSAWNGVVATFNEQVVQPVAAAWRELVTQLGSIWTTVTGAFSSALQAFGNTFTTVFKAISDAFNTYVANPLKAAWESISTGISTSLNRAVEMVQKAYSSLAGAITGAFNGIVGAVKGVLNQIIGGINKLIAAVNVVRSAVGLSPLLQISYLAEGGYITKPTTAVIGEGGEPEYVIPASKFEDAARNYLSGVRGEGVLTSTPPPINAISQGRPAPVTREPQQVASGPVQVNITTGPVMEFDGTRYVTLADMQRAVSEAARQTQDKMLRDLRQPGTRQRLGIS